MEEETLTFIAIGIGVIALLACLGVYTMIPEEVENPVTWGAITQYNDDITAIENRITELERESRPNYDYDSVLTNLRDDLDDLYDDYQDDFDNLDDDIDDLRDRLDELELIPGPQGPQGIQGPQGEPGDDADYLALDINCTTTGYIGHYTTTCELVEP